MGIFGIATGKDNIYFGTYSDVCSLCLREKSRSERIGATETTIKLRGKLEGKKILKIPVNGTNAVICMEHLHKLSDNNRESINSDSEADNDNE